MIDVLKFPEKKTRKETKNSRFFRVFFPEDKNPFFSVFS